MADFEDVLKPNNAELITEDQVEDDLRDRRHDRRSKAPEGIVTGSKEYWQWWRNTNKLRNRLYQKRNYLRKRKILLALQKVEEEDVETIEAALREVDDELALMKNLRGESVAVTRTTAKKEKEETVVVEHDPNEIPFVREMADKHHVDYATALTIMNRDDYRGDDSFTEHLRGGPPKEE